MAYNSLMEYYQSTKKELPKETLSESSESLEESDENEYTWSKSELIEFISSLTDEEVHEVGEFIWSELMYNEETDDYDDLEDEDFEDSEELEESATDETLTEIKFFDKKKAQVDREKRKNVAQRKRKSKLLAKYYKRNRAKISRKAKLYRKKAKRNPSKIKHHKGVQY